MTSAFLWIGAVICALLGVTLYLGWLRHRPAPRQERYRFKERHIEVLGLRICYVEKGPLPLQRFAARGPRLAIPGTRQWRVGRKGPQPLRRNRAIIFIHGLGGSLDNWNYNLPYFFRMYRVIALDLPGFGKSEKPIMPYSIPFFTKVLKTFMDGKGIDKAVLVGNSMGGHIALNFALVYPSRTEKIVLVDPSGAWKRPGLLLSIIINLVGSEWWFRHPAPWQIRWIISRIFFNRRIKPAREYEKRYIAWARSQEWHLLAQAIYRAGVDILYSTLRHRLSEVRVPTLLIWGREDRMVSVKLASYMHRRIPGSRLVVYDRCGHVPMMEKPKEFNREVEKFLGVRS